MKFKIFLSVLALGFIVIAFGQNPPMELTFTGENNGQYVPLDSVFIENLSQGGDTTLYAPDTILFIDSFTNIGNNQPLDENTLFVSQNYPNPFKGKTEFNLYLAEKGNIQITGRDIIGRELVHYENILNRGNHSFTFYAGNESYYLLTVTKNQTSQTIKMLNAGITTTNGEKCKIVYTGNKGNVSGFKSQQASNNFVFNFGDELKYTAHTDVEETELVDTPLGSQLYTFQFEGWTPCPGSSTVIDNDGNIYNTVIIGDQCWMKENLKTTTYNNNTPIPNATGDSAWRYDTSGAYVWYDNNLLWKDIYGGLYNRYAIEDTNGLCPIGWHIPDSSEWFDLFAFNGNDLKSCRQIDSPLGDGCNTTEHPRWDYDTLAYGTDVSGFSALPGGRRLGNGPFEAIGIWSIFWSSTRRAIDPSDNWVFYFIKGYSGIMLATYYYKNGFAVRCIKD